MHPDYADSSNHINDICLIKVPPLSVAAPEDCNDCFRPVCLPTPGTSGDSFAGQYCWIAGWGTISSGGNTSNKIRDAGVNIFSRDYCLEKTVYTSDAIDSMLHMCAGIPDTDNDGESDGGIDSCQGDSGGPLVCLIDNVPVQVGVTSWGHGCADKNTAGVYVNVAAYLDWIHDVMN